MKLLPAIAISALLLGASQATFAAGCVKGAVVGSAAGHVADGHGVAGAAAGCAIGHHEANKKAKQEQQTAPQQ